MSTRTHNNGMRLTSGGPMRASRASLMRRLQPISVLSGPIREGGMKVTATVVTCPSVSPPITRARRTGDDNDAEQTRLDLGRGDKCRRLDGQFVRYGAGGTG